MGKVNIYREGEEEGNPSDDVDSQVLTNIVNCESLCSLSSTCCESIIGPSSPKIFTF